MPSTRTNRESFQLDTEIITLEMKPVELEVVQLDRDNETSGRDTCGAIDRGKGGALRNSTTPGEGLGLEGGHAGGNSLAVSRPSALQIAERERGAFWVPQPLHAVGFLFPSKRSSSILLLAVPTHL